MFDVLERRESRPMHHILVLISSPILCQEAMSAADYLGIEVCGEFRPVIC